ncbi:hypothetical protein [Actinomyces succiniciruminis]|uniref:Uncharacterized protein n=1 Tax=Actinomyces succiniciruminis TaxID=1522002 RepID=A0A1L7RBW7_9ACTO|nr:hypothetical protein [Actinomyces succiniciruminis]CED91407.1 Hypothetical protein AAM4_1575 [Actinomyces succiniciruminis]
MIKTILGGLAVSVLAAVPAATAAPESGELESGWAYRVEDGELLRTGRIVDQALPGESDEAARCDGVDGRVRAEIDLDVPGLTWHGSDGCLRWAQATDGDGQVHRYWVTPGAEVVYVVELDEEVPS